MCAREAASQQLYSPGRFGFNPNNARDQNYLVEDHHHNACENPKKKN